MQLVYRWCKYAGLGAFMNNASIIALNLGLVSPSPTPCSKYGAGTRTTCHLCQKCGTHLLTQNLINVEKHTQNILHWI